MKYLTIILIFFSFVACKRDKIQPEKTNKVIIGGRIIDFNPNNSDLSIIVNRLGFRRLEIQAALDSLGYFKASFETKVPTDVWVTYNTNFLVLTHPGDSIFIKFNGKTDKRPELLESIEFSGDASKINKDASLFQKMYYSNELYRDRVAQDNAIRKYDPKQYLGYLDTLQQKSKILYDIFIADTSIANETKIWALSFGEEYYYHYLAIYPEQHQKSNGLEDSKWKVPEDYKDSFLKKLPLTKEMFISGYALSSFINLFHFFYLYPKILNDETLSNPKIKEGVPAIIKDIKDSLMVYGTIEQIKDTLLRQMVLTEILYQNLDQSEVSLFEKYRSISDSIIKLPFLREPLLEEYKIAKYNVDHPKLASDAMLMEAKNSSVDQIMDSILMSNKGKVVYMDLWATWCGPCLAEFPKSKILMNKMQTKDVVFIYVCIDSEERFWEPVIEKFELGGQNYLLSKIQSTEIKKVFVIQAVPFYVIIDKNGNIYDKGSHLRPDGAEDKILTLLKE